MAINIKPGNKKRPKPEQGENGRFVPGNNGGPGRPRGARQKLTDQLLDALQKDFAKSGVSAIVEMRTEKPAEYIKALISLLPKDVNLNINALDEMTETQLVDRMRKLDAVLAPFLAAADPGGAAGANGTGGSAEAKTRH